MTNYNDGNWHNWNGGECPVHPESVVAAIWRGDDSMTRSDKIMGVVRKAGDFQGVCWMHVHGKGGGTADIIAFRVIKEHKEPREFWVIGGRAFPSSREADAFAMENYPCMDVIHVREVLK